MYLLNSGRLLLLAGVDNVVLIGWVYVGKLRTKHFIEEVNVRVYFPDSIVTIVDWVDPYVEVHCFEFSFGVVSEVEEMELRFLVELVEQEPYLRVLIADPYCTTHFELVLPLGKGFSVVFPEVLRFVVHKLAMIVFGPDPADQLLFREVMDESSFIEFLNK